MSNVSNYPTQFDLSEDKLSEECGVFGISLTSDGPQSAAHMAYTALFALQHRGQQSAGIASWDEDVMHLHKDNGLAADVFTDESLGLLTGKQAVGHVRYSTAGYDGIVNAQPLVVRHATGSMALCCNSSLLNSRQLRRECENNGGIFQTTTNAEVISYILVRERMRTDSTEGAMLSAMQYFKGAYSIVILNDKKLIAARDPNGFRPLCMGRVDGCIAFASESCAFDVLGGELIRDLEPGEVISVEHGSAEYRSFNCGIEAKSALCVFEYIYFSRPDSVVDGTSVYQARMEAGKCLARRNTAEADIVIGVPDSGLAAAMGFAQEKKMMNCLGLVKNRYIGRTFIQPSQGQREKSVKIKLNALSGTVKGKRIILVDDSIVRGTTCARMVRQLRDAGATEVHMKSSAPPFRYPCYYGTDIPSPESLIAHNRTIEQMRDIIGVDSLDFLRVEELSQIIPGCKRGLCDACFTGNYAVQPIED